MRPKIGPKRLGVKWIWIFFLAVARDDL